MMKLAIIFLPILFAVIWAAFIVLRINTEYGSIEEDDISAQDLVDYHDDIETGKSVDLKFKQ